MTLSTHAVVGAGIVVVTKVNPLIAFIFGFMSHFLLDAIPHWDYLPRGVNRYHTHTSVEESEKVLSKTSRGFMIDLVWAGGDGLIAVLLVFFFFLHGDTHSFSYLHSAIVWGALGGMLPDFLQFVYLKTKIEPFVSLQKFHVDFMHAKTRLDRFEIAGPLMQIGIIFFVIFFTR